MSTHSNQHTPNGSSAIVGSNQTYRARKQRASRGSSTKPAGSNKRVKDRSVDGAYRTTSTTKVGERSKGYGDGHY